ncbi:hypothetical protein [Actinokineospora iranica]|uniref:Uncharacterized protein n=1 Tax=Actinokineospora iranica TaxID=1271860 RepID=A0A1G6STA3_9PSEU|nr:hypothetical protein [Actinokineospora iranica]SDD19911.1 hypothetical protein SAMN05216174_108154 [Actinokineospora iranica]
MYVDRGSSDFAAIGSGISNFLNAAKSGSFAVNEHGGQALLRAARELLDWYDEERHRLARLAETPQLGSSNNAEIMKPLLVSVATDEQGFLTQLAALPAELLKFQEAVKIAMANYKQADENAAGKLDQDG